MIGMKKRIGKQLYIFFFFFLKSTIFLNQKEKNYKAIG